MVGQYENHLEDIAYHLNKDATFTGHATVEDVKASDGRKLALVSIQAFEVASNRIVPRVVVVIHVHETLGEQVLFDATIEAILSLRQVADVQGAVRIAPDRSYQRMQIMLGGVSL